MILLVPSILRQIERTALLEKTIEWFGLEGTIKDYVVQPLCRGMGRDTFHQTRLLKVPSGL